MRNNIVVFGTLSPQHLIVMYYFMLVLMILFKTRLFREALHLLHFVRRTKRLTGSSPDRSATIYG